MCRTTKKKQPPDVFLEDQLQTAKHVLLPLGDPSLPPALRELPADWRGVLAAYSGGGIGSDLDAASGGDDDVQYVLSVRFDPFQADLYAGDELAISANRRYSFVVLRVAC